MTNEQRENLEKWLVALRSGEYKQGKGQLFDESENAYCCMGVACVVLGLKQKEESFEIEKDIWDSAAISTATMEDHFGISDEDLPPELAIYNDINEWTFEQIADFIEENYLSSERSYTNEPKF